MVIRTEIRCESCRTTTTLLKKDMNAPTFICPYCGAAMSQRQWESVCSVSDYVMDLNAEGERDSRGLGDPLFAVSFLAKHVTPNKKNKRWE